MRIITINTWKGDGAYHRRLDLLTAGLKPHSPDVVCLQEVLQTRDGGLDTARHLARELGMYRTWAPVRLKHRIVEGQRRNSFSGLAILSRQPALRHQMISLPPHPEDKERIAQWVDIEVGGRLWRVVNTHLTHIRTAVLYRKDQLCTLLSQIRGCLPKAAICLCGDLNAAPEDPEIQYLTTRTDWYVTDAYVVGGGQLPGPTSPVSSGRTHGRRIDHIFLLSETWDAPPPCRHGTLILKTPDADGHFPSDHAGVLVEIVETPFTI
jgi:endonuclease/exonuclease/phosphatase family metal-dependent hydrolase